MTQDDNTRQDVTTRWIAERIQELRQERGWSMQQLADRCVEAGMPSLKRSVLVNLQVGRRPYVTVSELLALGRVFDVPPVTLLTPRDRSVFCGKYAVDKEKRLIDTVRRDLRELLFRVRDVIGAVREDKAIPDEFLQRLDDRAAMASEDLNELDDQFATTPHIRVVGDSWLTDEHGRRL